MTVNGLGHSGHAGAEAQRGYDSSGSIPGLPSIANNSPDSYIRKLLAPIQGGEPTRGDLFSPLDGEGHGEHKDKSKWIKWAVAGLVALGFWRAAANRAGAGMFTALGRAVTRLGRRP